MNNKNESKGTGGSGTGASDPKRPHATLDLKATEIKPAAIKPGDTKPGDIKPAEAAKPADGKPADSKPGETAKFPAAKAPESGKPATMTSPAPGISATAASGAKTAVPPTGAASEQPKAAAPIKPAAADKPKPPTPVPATPTARVSSLVSHAAAAGLGALVTFLGASYLAEDLGLRPAPAQVEGLTARLAALENSARNAPSAAPAVDQIRQIEARLARAEGLATTLGEVADAHGKLAAETRALGERIAAQGPADMGQRIGRLEEQLAQIVQAAANDPSKSGRIPQIAQLIGRVTDLEGAVESKLSSLRKSMAQDIEARTGGTAETLGELKAGTTRLNREVETVKTEAQGLNQRLDSLKGGADRLERSLKALQEETGGIRTALDGVKGEVDSRIKAAASAAVAPVAGKVAAIETSLDAVVRRDEDRQANAERTLLTLELGNLKRALDAGRPFAREIAEIRKLSGGTIDLKALEAQSGGKVATAAELQREFRDVAHGVLDLDNEARSDGSIAGELLARAKSIVRVRKIGTEVKGDSAEAVLARMEGHLKEGELNRVLEEAKHLAPDVVRPAKAWLAKVEVRRSVDLALREVEERLKTSLAGKKG